MKRIRVLLTKHDSLPFELRLPVRLTGAKQERVSSSRRCAMVARGQWAGSANLET